MSEFQVIFVCMGNICRSPMAELVLRRQLAGVGLDQVVIADSAGTGDWHVGDPVDRRARTALEKGGYPTQHKARQFQASWFAERDLVVALDRDNLKDLKRMAPTRDQAAAIRLLLEFDEEAETIDVPDPYYGDAAGFDEVLGMIEQACQGLVDHLQGRVQASGLQASK